MAIPINPTDLRRFRLLTELFARTAAGELKIYVSKSDKSKGSYTSIELTGDLPTEEVREIFNQVEQEESNG